MFLFQIDVLDTFESYINDTNCSVPNVIPMEKNRQETQ